MSPPEGQSPSRFPLPPSPPSRRASVQSTSSSRSSVSAHSTRSHRSSLSNHSANSRDSSRSLQAPPSLTFSPKTGFRPRFDRESTSATVRQVQAVPNDSFYEGTTISVNQPVGSLSISPSSRDVCLASRRGLYILDLANLNNAPRFIAQGGTWQIADCQWSPHPATSNLILSTSSQKLLVWDLSAQKCLHKSIDAHARAITDINWHARNPNLMATVAMDAGIRGWDLRAWDRPFMRVCAWGAAGTQVKWNRQHEHWLATAHDKVVHVWDDRKGSVPVVTLRAHDSKIYGIDWDREHRHKLVTCSLDKTIKYWSINELAPKDAAGIDDYYDSVTSPHKPTHTISTSYPVWRARNLPFGHGVVALPQRGTDTLDMFGTNSSHPVETFEGHENVVKEFVWRSRGGEDATREDREFQLVTWGKDRTLRIWPVSREVCERVGYKYGAPIKVLHSRRGAADITYTRAPDEEEKKRLPPPVVNPSGIARQKMAKVETAMTRGGAVRARGMDQLEWLTKVVRNKASPDTSSLPSRIGSLSRTVSRGASTDRTGEKDGWISLKDEVVLVNKIFPRPKIKFEKIDLPHRKLTITLMGPWANGDRMAFIRIHWTFPAQYPYVPEIPSFELERNPTVSSITRAQIVKTIKTLRAENRQCLVSTCGFLLGSHERIGRKELEDVSDSEEENQVKAANVVMLIRTCGATFGPNGQLVCFFPKQTVLPRTKQLSRSPSTGRDAPSNPLAKAMSALSRVNNPNMRTTVNIKPRFRRFDVGMTAASAASAASAGSTVTLHDVAHLGNPDASLAKRYGMSLSAEQNLSRAFNAKRLDHAEVWATLAGLLAPQPPPYSALPPADRDAEIRRDRETWERGMARKKLVLNQLFARLIQTKDFQLLALIGCVLLEHIKQNPPPPKPEFQTHHSPEQDYFALPRHSSYASLNQSGSITPMRKHSRPSITPISPGVSSYKNSGWSQMLNASSLSLRGHTTPGSRQSFDVPKTTPSEYDEAGQSGPSGLSIPVPGKLDQSPRWKERARMSGIVSASPTALAAYRSSGSGISDASMGARMAIAASSDEIKPLSDPASFARHFRTNSTSLAMSSAGSKAGSASPLRRGTSRQLTNTPAYGVTRRKVSRICGVRVDLPEDDTEPPELLDRELRSMCEGFKLAYADFLLRCGLFGIRAQLLQYRFIESETSEKIVKPASGHLPLPINQRRRYDSQTVSKVCVACAAGSDHCVACQQQPIKPTCSYCRLPIRGLAATCATCAHRLHAKCFRAHFSANTSVTCPSCLCQCAAEGGTTGQSLSFPVPASSIIPTSGLTRNTARGAVGPLSPKAADTQRMTYASLRPIRESDVPVESPSVLGFSPDGRPGMVGPMGSGDSTGGWLTWDPAKIGWPGGSAGSSDAAGEDRGRQGKRRLGAFRLPGQDT